jgi:hypothetical protein
VLRRAFTRGIEIPRRCVRIFCRPFRAVSLGIIPRLKPVSANLMGCPSTGEWLLSPEGQADRSQARSAWESVLRKNRHVGYGMIGCSGFHRYFSTKCAPCSLGRLNTLLERFASDDVLLKVMDRACEIPPLNTPSPVAKRSFGGLEIFDGSKPMIPPLSIERPSQRPVLYAG